MANIVESKLMEGFYKYLDYLNRNYKNPNLNSRISSSFSQLSYINAEPNSGFLFNKPINLQLDDDHFNFLGYVNDLFNENFQDLVTPMNFNFSNLINLIRKDQDLCSKIFELIVSNYPVLFGTKQLIDVNSVDISTTSNSSPFLILPFNNSQIYYSDIYNSLETILSSMSNSIDYSMRRIE